MNSKKRKRGGVIVVCILTMLVQAIRGLLLQSHRGILRTSTPYASCPPVVARPPRVVRSSFGSAAEHPSERLVDTVAGVLEQQFGHDSEALLLVCVSGGLDSVALLRLLADLPKAPVRLEVLHFHHGLREESDEEALFVEQLARTLGLTFHLRRASKEQVERWQQNGTSIQQPARDWRRREAAVLLKERVLPSKEGFVVTAHHADDQIETMLLKLLRGVHLSSIRGMEVCGTPNEHGVRVLRPLCDISKGELREYVSRIGQTWREDPSNDSLKYKRNRVRHELVPIMADLAGGMGPLAQRLETMSKQSSAYRDWLGAAALAWEVEYVPEGSAHRARHVLPVEPLQHTSSPVQIEVIHRFIARSPHLLPFSAAASLPYDQMERVLSQLSVPSVDWSLHLTKAISVRRVGEVLKCGSVEEDTEEYEEQRSFCSSESEEKNLSVRVSSRVVRALARVGCSLAISMVDDAPGGDSGSTSIHVWPGARLAVRLREDGDRFVVAGTAEGNGRQKKVSEILRDRNVPLHLREDVIVLEALRKDPPNLLAMWVPDAMDPAGWNALVAHEGDEEVVDMAEEAAAMATTVYFSLKVKK